MITSAGRTSPVRRGLDASEARTDLPTLAQTARSPNPLSTPSTAAGRSRSCGRARTAAVAVVGYGDCEAEFGREAGMERSDVIVVIKAGMERPGGPPNIWVILRRPDSFLSPSLVSSVRIAESNQLHAAVTFLTPGSPSAHPTPALVARGLTLGPERGNVLHPYLRRPIICNTLKSSLEL
jgi:hypothetical protein